MKTTKNAYLAKLTEQIQMKSVEVGKNLEGTTPPSVFIGRWSYPKVYAGPMMSSQMGDTSIMDSPESWIGENKTQDEIINYRMNLVRGKQLIKIDDLENPFVEKLQDISLASKSIDSEATFKKRPRGSMLTEDSMPHGPSATIEKFDIDAVRWDRQLEKTFYDTDLKAVDACLIAQTPVIAHALCGQGTDADIRHAVLVGVLPGNAKRPIGEKAVLLAAIVIVAVLLCADRHGQESQREGKKDPFHSFND